MCVCMHVYNKKGKNSTNFASATQCALRNFEAMMLLLLNWAHG
jgi:hypothetical protein